MKKLMILAIAMMVSFSASAQIEEGNWYVTPKAGISIADLTGKLYDPSKAEGTYDATLRPLTTFTVGADFLYAANDNFGVSFGLSYARQGAKTQDDLFRVSLDYINVPVMVNYYPFEKAGLALKAGIQVGFVTHKSMKIDGVNYDKEYERVRATVIRHLYNGRTVVLNGYNYVESEWSKGFNKVDCSIPLAISYELYNVQLEARYNLGLTKIMKDDAEASKNSVWQFTLGYKFNLGD